MYELTEEQKQDIRHNDQDKFRGNKTFNYLMVKMTNNITDIEIQNKIEVMIAYLHLKNIFIHASGIGKLA